MTSPALPRRNRSHAGYVVGRCLAVILATSIATFGISRAEVLQVDSAMLNDPHLETSTVRPVFSPSLKPLWLKALQRPEAEFRRLAADTIAMAHARGMGELEDTASVLVQVFTAPGQDVFVRRAAARALVVLDARQTAEMLARSDAATLLQVAQVVEPALAKWDYQPIRERWLERVKDPGTPRTWLLLAINGLGRVGEKQATESLLQFVRDRQMASNVRLTAAHALARINNSGLVDEARSLTDQSGAKDITDRILAASILQQHDDPNAIELLKRLAADTEPPVAALAFERLFAIDPALVFDLAPTAITSQDARLRRLAARAFVAQGDQEAIRALAPSLDDVIPGIRQYVAESFFSFARQADLADVVIGETTSMLATDCWRGVEQAALLVGYLDHKPAASRLVQALEHERPEAYVTAAWALRRLAIPETLPAMLDKAARQHQRFVDESISDAAEFEAVSGQLVQLFEAFGQQRFRDAEALMRKFVPKSHPSHGVPHDHTEDGRAAACWALGYLYEDNSDEGLAKQFVGRMRDLNNEDDPEDEMVGRMCAVALGRMRAKSELATLQDMQGPHDYMGRSCCWSIERIDGTPMPPVEESERAAKGWFLESLTNDW